MSNTNTLPFDESDLIQIKDLDDSQDFVAISCEISSSGFCQHSGIVISFEEEIFYFHFTGKDVILENITNKLEQLDSLYVKKLDIVKEQEVVTFLGHCEKLKKSGVSPLYGFVFNNSYYDSTTEESYLVNCSHDITTCVGFCIKVIRGFIHNNVEYLRIQDWKINSLNSVPSHLVDYMKKYLDLYAKKEGIAIDDLFKQDELKRILPVELLSSGFFIQLPISKNETDAIFPSLQKYFIKIKAA